MLTNTIVASLWHRLIARERTVEDTVSLLFHDDIAGQETRRMPSLSVSPTLSAYDTDPALDAVEPLATMDDKATVVLPRIRRPHRPDRDELSCNALARDQHRAAMGA